MGVPNAEQKVLRLVGRVQSAVAPSLEGAVRSEPVSLSLAVVVRARRGLASRAERSSRHFLHALNLPAGSDIRRLLTQGATLERRIQELSKSLDDALSREELRHGSP